MQGENVSAMNWKFWKTQAQQAQPATASIAATTTDAVREIAEIAKLEVAAQANAFDQLDNKTGVALGFVLVAITQILIALFRLAADGAPIKTTHPLWAMGLVVVAVICFALSTALGLLERLSVGFDGGPCLSNVIGQSSEFDVLRESITHFQAAIVTNDKVIEAKAKRADGCAIFGIIGMFVVSALVVLLFWAVPQPEAKVAVTSTSTTDRETYRIPPRSLSVEYVTYRKQMDDCYMDVRRYREELDAGLLTRRDSAILDTRDAALLRAGTCIQWAAEPLPLEAQRAVEASSDLSIYVAEKFRYEKPGK